MTDAIARLNETERRILRRLAQGHTAKSIATIEACSVNAVNERLREARRKTGVGSSRELARMVAAQENRDDQIGVAHPAPATAPVHRQALSPVSRKWMIPMLILTIASVTTLTLAVSQPDAASSPSAHQMPDDVFESQQNRLAEALSRERRDPTWADVTERALNGRFADIGQLVDRTVRCGATLCQVSGRLTATAHGSVNDAMQALQGPTLDTQLRELGLKHVVSSFGPVAGAPKQARYVAFWTRAPAR